jgi:NitT/TauT family transport system substrate-binding protein
MKRRDFIKSAAVLGGAAAGSSLLAACAPAATTAASPTVAPTTATPTATVAPTAKPIRTLKVGYLPLTDFLGMYAAIEQGYMTDEGLKLDLQAMAGGATIIPAIVGGSLDFGISNYVSVIVANGQGIKIKAFSDSSYGTKASPPFSLVVKKGSPITTAAGLNGKKVAVNTRNGIVHVGVMEWIDRNGGDAKSVQYVELPFPQMPPAITSGAVDAAAPTEPFVTVATSADATILANYLTDLRDNCAIAGFVSTDDWIAKNRDAAAAFHRANTKGMDFVAKNETIARGYVAKYASIDPALAAKIKLSALRSTPLVDAVQFWIDLSKKWGLLDKTSTMTAQDLFVSL